MPEYAATCDRPTPRTRALCHEPLMRARTSFTPLVHSCRSWGTSGPCRVAGAGCAAEGEAALPRPPGMPLLHRPPPRTWVPRPPVLSGKDRSRVRPEWAIARHTGCDQSRAMSGLWRRGRRSRIRGVVGGFHRGSPHWRQTMVATLQEPAPHAPCRADWHPARHAGSMSDIADASGGGAGSERVAVRSADGRCRHPC